MSCKDEADNQAETLATPTRIAPGQANAAALCRNPGCQLPLLADGSCPDQCDQAIEYYPPLRWPPEGQYLPIQVRDMPPGPGFTRPAAVATAPSGAREGTHTGGVWISPTGEYWKPLDGRPAPNAYYHIPTREDVVLELMAGEPGFPRNWRVEETPVVVRGQTYTRRWLVRAQAYPLPSEDYPEARLDHVLTIERGIRRLNERGWSIGDHLTVAIDADTYEPFVLDLSAAHPYTPMQPAEFMDEDTLYAWAAQVGAEQLVAFRGAGRHLVWGRMGDRLWPRTAAGKLDSRYAHVYASTLRPLGSWAKLPGAYIVPPDAEDHATLRVHSWAVTTEPLPEDTIQAYELTWAWSPLPASREEAQRWEE